MRFAECPLLGAYVIDLDPIGDERGFFARMFCAEKFAALKLKTRFVQINNSLTASKGTVRGLHFQRPPNAEVKLMRCVRGAIFDVMVDLRKNSPTFGKWFGAELTAENRRMIYIPEGFAHGFMTLTDDVEVIYPVSAAYTPESEGGLRWNDSGIGIDWPNVAKEVSTKDCAWPDFDPLVHTL